MKARIGAAVIAALVIAVLALVGTQIGAHVIGTVRIVGNSMADTLLDGDIALINRLAYAHDGPEFGDVAAFRLESRSGTYVKRVIGRPGDQLIFRDDTLYLNGTALSEPYTTSATEDFEADPGDGAYFLMGDNRADSYDSRMADIGSVDKDDFLGRVCWVLWPLRRFGPVN